MTHPFASRLLARNRARLLRLCRRVIRAWMGLALGLALAHPVAGAEENPDSPSFDVLEYRVEGNTVLPTLAVEKAVYPYLGYAKSIADVEKARRALEQAYQSAGYLSVLVDIPEQRVESGTVTLRVVEGKVERLVVSGNRYYSRGYIRERVPAAEEGSVPSFPELQKQLTALSRGPDRKLTPVLRPGKTPGTLDVELKVDDRLPLHGEVELNNRQTPDTEPLRLQASLRYDNLWQRGHSISLIYQTAPQEPGQLQVYSGTYVMPLGDSGDALALYAVKSDSNVTTLGALNVIGKGTIAGARGIIPLRPYGSYFHSLTLGIDYKDFTDSVESDDTPISYIPLSLAYRGNYTTPQGSHGGSISLNVAPRGLFGSNSDEEFANKRFNASAGYAYLRGDWLSELALAKNTVLQLRLQGQATGQPLITNEQFCLGGLDTVPGYLECETLGDDALVGELELRRVLPFGREWAKVDLVAVAFVDGGMVWLIDALPGQTADFGLYSVGIGLRAQIYTHFQADLDLALPLANGPNTERYDPRILFRVAAQF